MTPEGKSAAIGSVSFLAFLSSIGWLVIMGAFGTWDLRFHEDWHWTALEWFLVAEVCGWIAAIKSRSTIIGKISSLLGAISLGVFFFIFLPWDAQMMAGGHPPKAHQLQSHHR